MQNVNLKTLEENSYLLDGNIAYIEQLYDDYLKDPQTVDVHWREYFDHLRRVDGKVITDIPLSDVRKYFLKLAQTTPKPLSAGAISAVSTELQATLQHLNKQNQVNQLINAYRLHGHFHAHLDPLKLAQKHDSPDLHLGYYGLTQADLDTYFLADTFLGSNGSTLRAIYDALNKTYCDTVGVEYLQVATSEEAIWLQQRFESVRSHPVFSADAKRHILKQLIAAEGLEKYLGSKYVGQKRFSLEGGTSLIPMLDELVQRAGTQGAKEIIIGMAHRGRLNVLVNTLGKSPERLFREFEGKPSNLHFSGDVKYHMGFSSDLKTPGGIIHLALAFNPSHLEIIDPVVEGSVRARQDRRADFDRKEVIPVLVHGDAAFIGQGVVMETFSLSQTHGFCTGGTVHIVINNQVGFTTSDPRDARSSLYCTDIAKMIQAPVFHVNGDDPEACVFVTQVALDYRMTFKKDVVIDLVCYRRHGHNEADEPSITQPIMYRFIKQHPYTHEIYRDHLVAEGVVKSKEVDKEFDDYRQRLDSGKPVIEIEPKGQVAFLANWKPYKDQEWDIPVDTSVSYAQLRILGERMAAIPAGFTLQPQVEREYDARRKMTAGELALNWGYAETMAYATLLAQGYAVRLCGQDSGRGTFAHRHAVLHDYHDGDLYIPLEHLTPDQATFWVIDSLLSEEGVLGFEYGYATTDPETLVLWEAQFGDFWNGAQVVVDQFISSGEQKWGRLCGLTMLLPHGYEGQGPEHTSARLERFLQLCAQKNIQVCVPTTPAQMFHLLRRQLIRPYRKPLIVMTPKSLLRNKMAVSSLKDLAEGEFQLVINEQDTNIKQKNVKRVILCSGKVYYDLLQRRMELSKNDVGIVRIEQLYPFPKKELVKVLQAYTKVKEIVWCQEEPENQGAWYAVQHWLYECLEAQQILRYVGRPASASPATGYTSLHLQQQAALVNEALG